MYEISMFTDIMLLCKFIITYIVYCLSEVKDQVSKVAHKHLVKNACLV